MDRVRKKITKKVKRKYRPPKIESLTEDNGAVGADCLGGSTALGGW